MTLVTHAGCKQGVSCPPSLLGVWRAFVASAEVISCKFRLPSYPRCTSITNTTKTLHASLCNKRWESYEQFICHCNKFKHLKITPGKAKGGKTLQNMEPEHIHGCCKNTPINTNNFLSPEAKLPEIPAMRKGPTRRTPAAPM